jgi:3-keto-5-aminohexanoate cleavage enzyme
MDKLIITVAVVGSGPTKKNNPNVPYSPEEIADEIVRSSEAGASIAHVHVRDPVTGAPSFNIEYFREVRDRVRSGCDVLLNFSTSGLNIPWGEKYLETRMGNTVLEPDLCSMDIASMNFGNRVFYNPPEFGPYCAKIVRERGIKPELELFDAGHFAPAYKLINEGLLDMPYLFQICLGVSGGAEANLKSFLFMTEKLPQQNAVWLAMGIGQAQFPVATLSMMQGGHVRVGFEDNVYLSRGVLAKSNAEQVEKVIRIAREFGREVATPEETRKILKIEKKEFPSLRRPV